MTSADLMEQMKRLGHGQGAAHNYTEKTMESALSAASARSGLCVGAVESAPHSHRVESHSRAESRDSPVIDRQPRNRDQTEVKQTLRSYSKGLSL
ncbi:hypothetical protein DdX_15482 [Ditylenchus destructor]|uniref:Uncharacterized protein n=1 Tax=Ditylenchus destructor TaxID=166010 RepID=A0AAD4MRE3_9BILA|nr:hypothetical protein DdX_15482 [Ditylenchus destructor]